MPRECITHHICDCHRERLDRYQKALEEIAQQAFGCTVMGDHPCPHCCDANNTIYQRACKALDDSSTKANPRTQVGRCAGCGQFFSWSLLLEHQGTCEKYQNWDRELNEALEAFDFSDEDLSNYNLGWPGRKPWEKK